MFFLCVFQSLLLDLFIHLFVDYLFIFGFCFCFIVLFLFYVIYFLFCFIFYINVFWLILIEFIWQTLKNWFTEKYCVNLRLIDSVHSFVNRLLLGIPSHLNPSSSFIIKPQNLLTTIIYRSLIFKNNWKLIKTILERVLPMKPPSPK